MKLTTTTTMKTIAMIETKLNRNTTKLKRK